MAQGGTVAQPQAVAGSARAAGRKQIGWIGAALLALVLALFPMLVDSPYYLHLVTVIAIYAILILGLDIVVGYTGQVSLGHAGLFGIGSYAAGILFLKFKLGIWWGLLAGIGVTAGFGVLLALPALRVSGPYLAMVTLAFGTIIQILINEMTELTNGPLGITLPPPRVFEVLEYLYERSAADRRMEFYFLVMLCLFATILVVNRIVRSPFGRAFEALRDSPIACDSSATARNLSCSG